MSEGEAKQIHNVWELPLIHRWRLYRLWLERYIKKKNEDILRLQIRMRYEHQALCELKKEEDVYVCQQSDVVGMTTTGAAKYQDLVQRLNPKIVIVEEAAEILESHIITSLAPGTEHLILIGDHQQLKPNPTVHMLAVKYDLNVSLFERMLKNGMQCYRLGIQHRMRPEIASLLVPHIYTELQNHESVSKYESIKGMGKNVFFLTHSFKELQEYDSKSKVNQHETKFMAQLCRYILLQGYKPSQITVLTTYSGQLFALKKEMYKEKVTEGVRITVVDNYQGEENDIILISFVRSNAEGNIGFLKISNRVCVALSRAKKGLFCIGNFELLAEKSEVWKNIINRLKDIKAIGPSLPLQCQNHPDASIDVSNETDFSSVPEGGCSRDCEFRLKCGHACSLKCHPYDMGHENIECRKPCLKYCNTGHLCTKLCYQECGHCYILVDQTVEQCGHTARVFCYLKDKPAVCPELCKSYLSCKYIEGGVKGVLKNVFFIDLDLKNLETFTSDSDLNKYVVYFLMKYFKYLIQQGYEASQITILTTDIKQFKDIEEKTQNKPFYHGLKFILAGQDSIDIVESDLMLVAFAQSEALGRVQFLEVSTQACITLSRAKKGIFCIGQFDQFANKYDFWKDIITALKQNEAIGPHLRLQCQNHPETNLRIENDKDFQLVPEGGCTRHCEFILSCGHKCSLKCHPYDMPHDTVKCYEPCNNKCDYGHLCQKKCFADCGYCEFIIDKKLNCGHVVKVKCGSQSVPTSCSELCEIYLPCGHMCASRCGDPCGKCTQNIKIKSTICPHEVIIKCSEWDNNDLLLKSCKAPCGMMMSCGHLCQGTCSGCYQGRLHTACKDRCPLVLICGHQCYALCCESCPPCIQPCENKCAHIVCSKTCGEPCDKCSKPCEWFCTHKNCSSLCSENGNHISCDEPCLKSLKCGHKCIGLCGEPCPEDCRICDQDKTKFTFFGFENVSDGKYIRLEDCKHIFEVHSLTEWMFREGNVIQLKRCPKCKVVIRDNHHFGNIVKACHANIDAIKKITYDATYCEKTKKAIECAIENMRSIKIGNDLLKAVTARDRNIKELNILESIVRILQKSNVFNSIYLSLHLKPISCDSNIKKKLISYVSMTKKWLFKFIICECLTASEQQLQELAWEVRRLTLAQEMSNVILEYKIRHPAQYDDLEKLCEGLITYAPFREKDDEKFFSEFEKLFKSTPDIPKLPILKTSGTVEGNWFQCMEGHVYSVMKSSSMKQVSKCYECDKNMLVSDVDIDSLISSLYDY